MMDELTDFEKPKMIGLDTVSRLGGKMEEIGIVRFHGGRYPDKQILVDYVDYAWITEYFWYPEMDKNGVIWAINPRKGYLHNFIMGRTGNMGKSLLMMDANSLNCQLDNLQYADRMRHRFYINQIEIENALLAPRNPKLPIADFDVVGL